MVEMLDTVVDFHNLFLEHRGHREYSQALLIVMLPGITNVLVKFENNA